jgi:hypothetical protein
MCHLQVIMQACMQQLLCASQALSYSAAISAEPGGRGAVDPGKLNPKSESYPNSKEQTTQPGEGSKSVQGGNQEIMKEKVDGTRA